MRAELLELRSVMRVVLLRKRELPHAEIISALHQPGAGTNNIGNTRRSERSLIAKALHQIRADDSNVVRADVFALKKAAEVQGWKIRNPLVDPIQERLTGSCQAHIQ